MFLPIIFFGFCVFPTYTLEQKKTIITHILENNINCTFPPKEILQKLTSCERPTPEEGSIDFNLDLGLYMCLDLLEINKQLCAIPNLMSNNATQFNLTFEKFQPNCNEVMQNLNSTKFKQSYQNLTKGDEKFCYKYKSDYMIKLLIYGNKLKNEKLQEQLTKKNLKKDKVPIKKNQETLLSEYEKKKEIDEISKKGKDLSKHNSQIDKHQPTTTITTVLLKNKENEPVAYPNDKEDMKYENHEEGSENIALIENDNTDMNEDKNLEKLLKSSSTLSSIVLPNEESDNNFGNENEEQEPKEIGKIIYHLLIQLLFIGSLFLNILNLYFNKWPLFIIQYQ